MPRIKLLLLLIPFFLVTAFFVYDMKKNTVLICYGKLNPETTKGYDYLILESKHYFPSNVRVLKSQNKTVFAYVSLGEVNANAVHFNDLKKHTLGKNKIWNSYYLDLKSEETIETLVRIIDEIFAKGYDGLFLDNLDNFTIHGPQKDQKAELVGLLKKIKEKYPKKKFIQNAGLDLISETSKYVDLIAIESIASSYDFKSKSYNLRDKTQFENGLARLKEVNETYKIPVILIEYSGSEKLCSQINERIKDSKFDNFIGNIDLQKIPIFKKQ